MGRPATAVSLSLLSNNKPHRSNKELEERKRAEKALQIAKDALKAPKWLSKSAQKEFKFIVDQTQSIELLNNLDIHVLAVYCNTYDEYIRVSQRIAEDGPIVEANKASETVEASHPLYVKQYQLLQSLKMLMTELGLSPNARSKMALHNAQQNLEKKKGAFDNV